MIGELVLYGDGDLAKFLDGHAEFRDLVLVKSRFPENTVTVVPSGFDHSIPGTTVQFIMMMVLIYGGITVMEDRKKGILGRLLFSPLSTGELFQAKVLGRWLMGLLQALMLIAVGKIFFRLNLGNFPLSLLVLAVFALAMAALSVFIGSLIGKEDMIVGLAVLLANIFAGLGGLLVAERDRGAGPAEGGHGLSGLLGDGRPSQAEVLQRRVSGHPTAPRDLAGAGGRADGCRRPVFQDPRLGRSYFQISWSTGYWVLNPRMAR